MGNHIGWSRSRNRSSDCDYEDDDEQNKTTGSGSSSGGGRRGCLKRKHVTWSNENTSSSNTSNSGDEPFDEELNTTLSMLLSASGASGSPLSKSKSASLYNRVSNFKMSHKHEKTAGGSSSSLIDSRHAVAADLLTPQRKKMKSTSAYIYNTLFKNGENSDIVVRALGREYHLHKLYLCQSPYFDSMFKGSKWRESSQSHIEIAIPDQNINERALDITFGSFYSVEVDIMPVEAVNVLACASLFSLDGLIEQCQSVMLENINAHTVCSYYNASIVYGVSDVANKSLTWFSNNIIINQDLRLGDISPQLFERIVSSPNLMIIRVETDLYSLCKRWLYFQLNKVVAKLEAKSWQKVTNEYFRELIRTLDAAESTTDNTSRTDRFCLLDDAAFEKYLSVFRKIRIKNILGDLDSLKLLYSDRIIPIRWIEPYYYKNWLNLLFVDQDHLSGEYTIDKIDFDNECIRFGRILDNDSFYNWRWVGFNFGIDLILSHANRNLTLKRNTLNSNTQSPYKGLLSNKATIRIYYVVKVVELDKQGNEVWSQQTEITCLDLHKNDEKHLLTIGSRVNYPLILNMHVASHPFNLNYFNLSEDSTTTTAVANTTTTTPTTTTAATTISSSS